VKHAVDDDVGDRCVIGMHAGACAGEDPLHERGRPGRGQQIGLVA
jgi:hypothetical protein